MAIPIDSIQKGQIPLVVSTSGTALRTISNCKEWVEACQKARRARKRRERAGGLVHTVISSDSESSFPYHSPDPPEPLNSRSKVKHQGTKKGKPAHYIEVPDPSGSESESESAHPKPSTSSRSKDKHRKYHYSSKKRPRSQSMSDSESEDPDTAKQAKKRTKESRGKKGSSHHNPERRHKKSKKANGKAMMHVYILIQSKYTCHRFTEEMDKRGTAKFFIYLIM
jgi:hypothetical protein